MFDSLLQKARMAAAMLAGTVGIGRALEYSPPVMRSRGKGQGRPSRLLTLHRYLHGARPTDKRHWHDGQDPVQQERVLDAADKRIRKAEWLRFCADQSAMFNRAHYDDQDNLHARFNPFYVNRG